jgi:hypothetical protein
MYRSGSKSGMAYFEAASWHLSAGHGKELSQEYSSAGFELNLKIIASMNDFCVKLVKCVIVLSEKTLIYMHCGVR